jgi:hypothetical protein
VAPAWVWHLGGFSGQKDKRTARLRIVTLNEWHPNRPEFFMVISVLLVKLPPNTIKKIAPYDRFTRA